MEERLGCSSVPMETLGCSLGVDGMFSMQPITQSVSLCVLDNYAKYLTFWTHTV